MPLIDITLPDNAFTETQKQQLAQQATDLLLEQEGMEHNPRARRLTWVYLHPHSTDNYYIGGQQSDHHHYKVEVSVFAGTLPQEKKEKLTRAMTQLILDLEGTDFNLLNAARIWVLFHEIEDGNWGGAGQIYRLNKLMKMMQEPIT